jgi:hypothetical protein
MQDEIESLKKQKTSNNASEILSRIQSLEEK